jgi:uncharacterized protein YecE (DUF72 family)
MEKKVLIGTSGWSYDEWVGPFYPRDLGKENFLVYYSEIFDTNEINTSFYQIPHERVVEKWVANTPDTFRFTAKLPKAITHDEYLSLDRSFPQVRRFLSAMNPLVEAGKLLSILIQLPPTFTREEHFGALKSFIKEWPDDPRERGYHLTVEFRHESWMEESVFEYLKENEITYCAVIEPKLPDRMDVTAPEFAYIRFHGFGKDIWFDYLFTETQIADWAKKVKKVIEKASMVGIYFNNHFSGYAVKNALMMMGALGFKPKKDPKKVSILDVKKKSGSYSKGQLGLDTFF